MKRSQSIVGLVLLASIGFPKGAIAQVVQDSTVGTAVNAAGNSFTINGGMRSGNNLFHSFSQFSVPTNSSAIFNNATDIQNIFSRVTGSSVSNIDGLMKANGTASLFLMNPNGIIFGPNAKLDLGGSFVGTTANSIKFQDGIEFSAGNLTANPLLSVKVPIGLQMGTNSGSIQIQDNGHTLTTLLPRSIPVPTLRDPNNTGLAVSSGKTLALIGGEIALTGGILTAEQGRIELGAVRSGRVGLDLQPDQNLIFKYDNALTYGNLQFNQRSLVDVSGSIAGSIELQGQNITFARGSMVLNQNLGSHLAGITRLNAIEAIHFQDASATTQTGIRSESLGPGEGSRVEINTQRLRIDSSAAIDNSSYGSGKVGGIQINATDKVEVSGFSPVIPFIPSTIGSAPFGNGQGAQVNIKTNKLTVSSGGVISVVAQGRNKGSDLNIQASEIVVSGLNPIIQLPSTIAATTFSTGQGGDLKIEADRITVQDIGFIASSTLASGSAGNLIIRASQWIETNGFAASINSSADRLSPVFQRAFGLPEIPSGNSGNLNIMTPQLRILNGGQVSVRSDGPGRAGILTIDADSIQLSDRGEITASTVSGNGGNIQLNVNTSLIMRNNSLIANDSFGTGDGGETIINTPVLVGLGNSDIEANAIQGTGGTIQINTQGIFGLQYRPALTPDNDITASSEFGINGNVQVNTIGINPANAFNTLPVDVVDSSRQIVDRCSVATTSSFIATGRGGMPQTPLKNWGSDRPWKDLRPIIATTSTPIQPIASISPITQLVEASAIEVDETGAISLVAPQTISSNPATCATSMRNP
jgi:filamentous hemagglutinin family protein